jgi:hypothetical protein
MSYDDLIFNFTSHRKAFDDGTWKGIAMYVVKKLVTTVGHGIYMVESEHDSYSNGFSIDIRSGPIGTKPWHFGLRGIVGGQLTRGAVYIRAWLFPYFTNVRLSAVTKGDVLVMRYAKKGDAGAWETEGWSYGEPGEWDAFANFNDDCAL